MASHIGELRKIQPVYPTRKDHFANPGTGGRMILKWNLIKQDIKV
jgi:hypothetical protein